MNKVIDTMENRVSLRSYAEKKIPDEVLNRILHSAMRAPTAGNMMLYSIVVIKDQKIKDTLSVTCDNQPFIAKAPVLLLFVADFEKWHRYFKISDIDGFEKRRGGTYHTPSVADLMLCISDALIAAQNAVIAAESLEIGSCYIGDIMENYEIHKKLLNLPKYAFPIALLTLGYYKDNYKKKLRDRFDPKYIIFDNEYKTLSDDEILDLFKEREKLFNSKNPYGALNYAQMFYGRKNGSEFMKEMERSIEEMLKNWNY